MDNLQPEMILERCKRHLQARDIVREVLLFDSVNSTNRTALEMASLGVPGGIVIIAETQGAGKGRMGRSWFSPKGVNLYLSLMIRPHQPTREFPLFSLATAVALVEAIAETTGLKAQIKWPNDILINDKKVGGILLESQTEGSQAPPLVVGIGLNINLDQSGFPSELQESATSLRAALGTTVDRSELTISLLCALARQYLLLEEGKKEGLIAAVKAHCHTLGKKVRIDTPHRTFEGWAETIEEEGALRIRLGDGSRRQILVGDITHLREMKG